MSSIQIVSNLRAFLKLGYIKRKNNTSGGHLFLSRILHAHAYFECEQ